MSPRRDRAPEGDPPVISTPGNRRDENGKRFALETIGKALGVVLGAALLGLAVFIATGRAYTIISLPPRVDALEAAVYAPHPMPSAEAEAFAQAIAAKVVAALPAAKKGKP